MPAVRIVILAAGFSARLGEPKALARIHGATLLQRTLDVVAPFARGSRITVVIPPGAHGYRIAIPAGQVDFVANSRRAAGLSSSVRLGLAGARYCSAALLLPVDLAELQTQDIARLMERWRGAPRRVAARRLPAGQGAGTPLILPRWLHARAAGIAGDTGLRDLVRTLPAHQVTLVDMPSAARDIDTPADLVAARRRR